MRNQHDGLTRLAFKHKVRLDNLGAGEHVLFLNTRLDKIKMYSANGVLSYYRAPGGNKLNLNMVSFIPQCFGGSGMNWQKAERLAVESMLAKLKTKHHEPSGEPLETDDAGNRHGKTS